MPRIPGVEPRQAGPLIRLVYWLTRRKFGRVLTPVRIAAYQPRLLLQGLGGMESAQQSLRSVPQALKSLVQIQAAMMIGCRF